MTSHDTFGLVTGSSRIFSSQPPVSLIKKTKSNLLVQKTDAIKTVKPTKCFLRARGEAALRTNDPPHQPFQ